MKRVLTSPRGPTFGDRLRMWFRVWSSRRKGTNIRLGGSMSTDVRKRKAANLTPCEALALIDAMQQPETHAILAMAPAERDLQCLLDVHNAVLSAGHDTLASWWRKDKIAPHTAVWRADRSQEKRSL